MKTKIRAVAPGAVALGAAALSAACSSAPTTLTERLEQAIDDAYEAEPMVPGVMLALRHGGSGFEAARGYADLEAEQGLEIEDPFRIASVTKTFTAAAALVYIEQGALDLEEAIGPLLLPETREVLRQGGYDVESITVGQLLAHTAGIFDYTEAESFYETLLADPGHRWSRAEQVQLAMDEGEPLNEPGEAYHYGDTHYVLLGEILEQLSGVGLAQTLRSQLRFEELGLRSTFLESLEAPPETYDPDRLTHPYIDDLDTREWDPSWDLYGGGGLVSTNPDLVVFFDALFLSSGGVFSDPSTLETLLTMPPQGQGEFSGMDGGMGINRFYYEDIECFAGLGFFSSWLVRCPELDLTFSYTLSQAEPRRSDRLLLDVIAAIVEEQAP